MIILRLKDTQVRALLAALRLAMRDERESIRYRMELRMDNGGEWISVPMRGAGPAVTHSKDLIRRWGLLAFDIRHSRNKAAGAAGGEA